jgi:subtilase family serine protease
VAVLATMTAAASAEPFHVLINHRYAQPPTTAQCEQTSGLACYGPPQFEQAYGLKSLYNAGITGAGKTIVIVDAFGSPTIQTDLATFDSDYGLPAPSLKIIAPDGPIPPFDPNNADMGGWALETSLDVEYSHAIAPGANILLVETPVSETEGTTGFPQIVEAENYVIDHHLGDVISQSFGATEETFPNAQSIYNLRSAYINAAFHHVTVLGSSGDGGATDETASPDAEDFYPFRVNSWPSADPLVTSVGGTHLQLDANGNRTAPDSVWNDGTELFNMFGPPYTPASGGGGVSEYFGRPYYQDGVRWTTGGQRGTPDVSMSAAVDGGANVYLGFDSPAEGITSPGYYIIGGTSEASPEFSGMVALADQAAGHDLGLLNPTLYAHGDGSWSGLTDITAGNNTVTFENPATDPYPGLHTVTGFNAAGGYDLASGLGTPNGPAFVSEFAPRWQHHRGGWHKR